MNGILRPGWSTSTMSRCILFATIGAAVLAAAPAQGAQEYTVLDLGPDGVANQPWSISGNALVAGYSNLGDHDEGFFADGERFVFIGTPPGTSRTDLLGVNRFGHAAGKSGTVYEDGQAILWTDDGSHHGRTRSLGTLGGSRSAATSINDNDQVVGWSHLPGDAESRPFLWQDDAMTPLPILGGTQGSAEWINNAGRIVGGSTTDSGGLQQFAVLWDGGDLVRLPPEYPGFANIARYIHDDGDIAGSITRPDEEGHPRTRAAVWRDREVYLELGTLADGSPAEPFATSWASAVNAGGVVVGMSVNAASSLVPFVYRNGEMAQLSDLLPPGWVLDFVGSGSLNDAGQIVVSGFPEGQPTTRALLLTPLIDSAVRSPNPHAVRLQAAPNPFRGATILQFLGPPSGWSEVEVFDPSGRRVCALPLPASGQVRWNATDSRGGPVPAGVYFATVPGSEGSLRLLHVR